MPSIYDLKPKFQGLLRPLANALARLGVTANQVTLLACTISIGWGVWMARTIGYPWPFLLLPLWFFLRMALNAIDGMLAREHDMRTPLGAFLNELTDVVSDAALYLPFALLPGVEPTWVVLVVLLATLTEMTGVVAVQVGAQSGRADPNLRRYDGPMGKSDRAFVFGALGLAVGIGLRVTPWFNWVMLALLALLALTVLNRVRRGLAALRGGEGAA